MSTNFDVICNYLTSHDFKHEVDAERQMCHANISLTQVRNRLLVHAPADDVVVTMLLVLPVIIPPDRRAAAGEFLHRVNYEFRVGSFELDLNAGEVRFRVANCFGETLFTDEMIGRWLHLSATTVDGFFPALMKVVFAQMAPAQAVEQGEGYLRDLLKKLESDNE